jgi:hypothetical protein
MAGIMTQSAQSILEEVDEFYFGGVIPWYHGTELVSEDGSLRLNVSLTDPEDDTNAVVVTYGPFSAARMRGSFLALVEQGQPLCCVQDILEEGIGYGCAQDLDLILQHVCYGEIIFG